MAHKILFKSLKDRLAWGVGDLDRPERDDNTWDVSKVDELNEADGHVNPHSAEAARAQYGVTGGLNTTYDAHAQGQLDPVLRWCAAVEPAFVAQVGVCVRRKGPMKDLSALLTAWLAQQGWGGTGICPSDRQRADAAQFGVHLELAKNPTIRLSRPQGA